jgi:hypothetical protein
MLRQSRRVAQVAGMSYFPVWIRATHWINVLFIGFLIRAGIQILGAYPRLYLNDHLHAGHGMGQVHQQEDPDERPMDSTPAGGGSECLARAAGRQ